MNKADYIALVNTKLPDDSALPSSDHRDTMHTSDNSVLDLIYGDSFIDTHTDETYTQAYAGFEYEMAAYKVGQDITVKLNVEATDSANANAPVLSFTDTDLLIDDDSFGSRFIATKLDLTSDTLKIQLTTFNSTVRIGQSVLAGERFSVVLTYKSKN
jgi:hypothetical protein